MSLAVVEVIVTVKLSPSTFVVTERTLSVATVGVTKMRESAVTLVVLITTRVWPASIVPVPTEALEVPSGSGDGVEMFIFSVSTVLALHQNPMQPHNAKKPQSHTNEPTINTFRQHDLNGAGVANPRPR